MSKTCKDLGIDSKAVRAWAKENGLMGDQIKGRISADVIDAFIGADDHRPQSDD